jgi:RNA polymerase sigma-70 factor (ECF subfamily)
VRDFVYGIFRRMTHTLLQLVASGDAAAMHQCIDRYSGLVWTLARRMVGRDAEDAVQEIFVAVWKSAARFDPAAGSEAAFIAMIARRRLIDRLRGAGRQPVTEGGVDLSNQVRAGVANRAEVCAEAACAASALEQLTPEQQLVIGLSIQRGLAYEQISVATGMPLGTVKTHIRRGLMRVRELLETTPAIPDTPGQEVRR